MLNRCKEAEDHSIEHTVTQCWSVTVMEHQINAGLFQKQGKLPNDFQTTITESLKIFRFKGIKDQNLLDFIAGNELMMKGILNSMWQ